MTPLGSKAELTYPLPVAHPVPRFCSPISPQDPDYGWLLEEPIVCREVKLTPVEDSGRNHPKHLSSDVF